VGGQEVRLDRRGTVRAGNYNFFLWKKFGTGVFVHHRIVSAVKRVEFVSDSLSYIILRERWCNIIVLNLRAPSEEKSDNSKDRFFYELQQVLFIIFLSTIGKFY
jgi:hypothetical protein